METLIELGLPVGHRSLFTKPAAFQEFLTKNNKIEGIYDAMASDDLADVVMVALKALVDTQHLPPMTRSYKSEQLSEKYRGMGNGAFKKDNHQHALMFYNQAILFAPKGSRQMKLAVSNRSALLLKLKAYKACLKDIETCFAMGCPNDIVGKLKKRKQEVMGSIASEEFTLNLLDRSVDKFISTKMAINPIVPCASRYINFVGSVTPKVVASTDIKVGTVVSSEKAYVSYTEAINALFACYYCQKQELNLIPCESCCFAMFCNETCRTQCLEDYHKYECYIINSVKAMCYSAMPNLMMKTVLKMRSKCKSWAELIDESYKVGIDRMKNSSYKEIYDSNELYSALNIKDDRPLVYGILYNASFIVASLVHYFGFIPSFYPADPVERQLAMRAIGRIMIFLASHQTPVQMYQIITNLTDGHTHIHNLQNHGIYSFTGKLKKSCKPNLFVINRNNEQILMAIRTIKSGEELTISYQQHLLDANFNRQKRNINNFLFLGNVCDCSICSGSETLAAKGQLSDQQKRYYNSLNFNGIDECLNSIHLADIYKKLLQALDVLGDVPYSEEYEEIYKRFRRCSMFYEAIKGNNFNLGVLT